MKILIVKISAIGDVIMTLPVLPAFKKKFPDSEIDWVVGEAASGIIKKNPFIEKIIIYPQKEMLSYLKDPLKWPNLSSISHEFIRNLREKEYDLVIDFQGLMKSGLITRLAKATTRSGFAGGREGSSIFLNHKLPPFDPDEHAVDRYLRLAAKNGADLSGEVDFNLGIDDSEDIQADKILDRYGISVNEQYIALVPGTVWDSKKWTPEGFSFVAEKIFRICGYKTVITGSAADTTMAKKIASFTQTPVADITGQTSLRILAAVFSRAAAVLSVDTGPMHLAVAAGGRVISLFGPTASWRTGPYGTGHFTITSDKKCTPCFKRKCETKKCMLDINREKVLDAVLRIIQKNDHIKGESK